MIRFDYPEQVDGIDQHQYFENSHYGYKSVCTSWVLGSLGIPPTAYHYSAHKGQRDAVLRRNGYAVRSRVSHAKRGARGSKYELGTVNELRETLKNNRSKWGDKTVGAAYLVAVMCPPRGDDKGGRHLILLTPEGHTHTDTAPVPGGISLADDTREVLGVQAVFPNGRADWLRSYRPRSRRRRGAVTEID